MNNQDEKYIRMTFQLALSAKGMVSPNPLVGCVIVKNEKVIATGYHKKAGQAHAELDAINNARESIEGATLYCNLEPCCHTNKRTPPCAQRLIKEKIKRVVISNLDPNPEVAGKGVKLLEENGIEVTYGLLRKEGEKLNEIFFHHIINKTPFIELKYAQTIDGKIATKSSHSKWITSEVARSHVHEHRMSYDAIMVGANTIRIDDPSLTIRTQEKELPLQRIIFCPSGSLPNSAKVLTDKFKDFTIVITENTHLFDCKTLKIQKNSNGQFDFENIFKTLYENHGITSIYIEGGSKLITSIVQNKLYNRLSIYMAPKIIGHGIDAIGDLEIESMPEALEINITDIERLGKDFYISGIREG